MLTSEIFSRRRKLRQLLRRPPPRVLALFSFRYDAHLVPDLIANVTPMVDGWVSYDDRGGEGLFTNEIRRRMLLIERARQIGADWVMLIDPDERIERRGAERMREMTARVEPVLWGFRFRELYAPDSFRVDGRWGSLIQYRLFPLLPDQVFPDKPLHSAFHPRGKEYRRRRTGLNLYHLKMITRERRLGRRDLYKHLDPDSKYQAIGYDHLAQDEGAVFEKIRKGRGYLPRRADYEGLWMPDVGGLLPLRGARSPDPETDDHATDEAAG